MKRRLFWITLLAVIMALAACGGEEDQTPRPPQSTRPATTPLPPTPLPTATYTPLPVPEVSEAENEPTALLRVVHASPDLPAVNFYLDGLLLESGLTLGQYSPRPQSFAPGRYTLRVLPPSETLQETTPLVEFPLELTADQNVYALLVGSADDPRIVLYEEDLSPLPARTARLSVIAAVPRSEPVSVRDSGDTLLENLDFGIVGGPVELPSGQHFLDFVSGSKALNAYTISLDERQVYTLLLVGQPGQETYRIVKLQSLAHSITQVRVAHASPDTPVVDVYLDDTPIAEGLAYRDFTGWASYRSTAYTLRLLPAGEPDAAPLYTREVNLPPNGAVDLVLLDAAERLRVLQVDEDLSATPINSARLMFINAAIGTTSVSIDTFAGPLANVSGVSFGSASQPVMSTDGPRTLLFNTLDSGELREVDMLYEYNWQAGHAYTVIITGYPDTDPPVLDTEVGADPQILLGNEGVVRPEATQASDVFQLRLIHALANTGPVTVEVDDTVIFDHVRRGTTTPYRTFSFESAILVIRDEATGNVILREPLGFQTARRSVIVVYNDETGQVRYELAEDRVDPTPAGEAHLRVMHLVPYRPPLELLGYLAGTPAPVGAESAAIQPTPVEIPLSDPAQFGLFSSPKIIPPGTFTVNVYEIGTTRTLALSVPEITFERGTFYDLLLLPAGAGQNMTPVLIPQPQ